ncbi:phosphatase PAP2 family protein [Cytobacillus sp. FJAT-54145]|uniref:Phosphatase PAP2 family protein n=1 Tax=Cytobacillus spartinae TaxID=3299023 RepID=A0ABW6KA01_9BACI
MDIKLFRAIFRLSGRSSLLDQLMILTSNKIRYVYIFVLLVMWIQNDGYKKIAIQTLRSTFIAFLVDLTFRFFLYRPRPFIKRRVGILIPSKVNSSFPSKHTLLVFAVSTSILLYQRTLGLLMTGLSLLTGLSRIWVGHHYPSDIIGSALLGSLTSLFPFIFSRLKR